MKLYQEVTPREVAEQLKQGEPLVLIDVRELDEWQSGHITQSIHIPMNEIPDRMNEIPQHTQVILVCRSGSRSAAVCDYLVRFGFTVANLTGGILQWPDELAYGEN